MSLPPQLKPPIEWIRRARYRALVFMVAIVLAAAATIMFTGLPWLPVVGAAVVTAAVSVSKMTTRLIQPTCLCCGRNLAGEPIGVQGIACPECGSVQMPSLVDLARMPRPDRSAPDRDDSDEA